MGFSKPAATPIAISVTFPALAILAVAARFWARKIKHVRPQIDDWMSIPALLTCVGNAIVLIVAAAHGQLGKKMPLTPNDFPITNPDLETFQKCIYANEILSTIAIMLTRFIILLFYARIFIQPNFRIAVWIMHILNFMWGIAFTLTFVFQCTPIDIVWRKTFGERHCIPLVRNLVLAVSSIILDVMVLIMPWPIVWQLKISKRQKWIVIGIFMLGAIVIAAAIGKCWIFFKVAGLLTRDHQITYDEATLMYWTVPETCIAVVCACLPTLRPIFIGMSPESIIGSIRSMLSLRSLGGSNHSSPHRSAAQKSTAYGSAPGSFAQHGSDSMRGFVQMSDEGGATTPPVPVPIAVRGEIGTQNRIYGGGGQERNRFGVLVGSAQGLGKGDGILVQKEFGADSSRAESL